jgi:hypothetical protein
MASPAEIQSLIVDQLAAREMEILSLVVAVRRTLNRSGSTKGDLSAMVKSALKKLVASNAIVETDGRYSLRQPNNFPSV